MSASFDNHLKVLNLVTGGPSDSPARTPRQMGFEELQARLSRWIHQPGIHGFGLSGRVTNGKNTGELAVKVYVDEKLTRQRLGARLIPRYETLPDCDSKIGFDVEAIERFAINSGSAGRGSQVGRAVGEPGTLGCFVQKKGESSQRYVLSNAHVLAWSEMAEPHKGDPIFSVGTTGQREKIAELDRWVRLRNDPGYPNTIDAAIARIDDSSQPAPATISTRSSYIYEGMPVSMTGASSGLALGRVKDLYHRLRMTYAIPGRPIQEYGFNDQVLVEPRTAGDDFSCGGDSGSAVVNARGKVVGLHFAGSGVHGIFNRITNVFSQLEIELVSSDRVVAFDAAITPKVDERERAIDVLARTIWGEARGEPVEGREAVAAVIVNRTDFDPPRWWGGTIEEVCLKASQFSCWNANDSNRQKLLAVTRNDPDFQQCLEISTRAVNGNLQDKTSGATHYLVVGLQKNWTETGVKTAIGNHVFYAGID